MSGGTRERLADVAARIMIEQGINDFSAAKRKAAIQLGVAFRGALPSNREIEASIRERQRIFEPSDHSGRLYELRHLALRLMTELQEFEPRLVGSVLSGTATINAEVELHVFCDAPEDVAMTLRRCGRAARAVERRIRWSLRQTTRIPGFRFSVSNVEVLVLIFARDEIRQAPLSIVDQRPMRRAAFREVQFLQESSKR